MSDLTRTRCVELLREFGYTGPVSYPMPRLRELVRELGLDPYLLRDDELIDEPEPAPKPTPAKKAQAKASSDGKYGGGKSTTSNDPTLSKGPGATLECGHIATGSIAAVGDKPICFVCKKPKAVTKEWAR